MYYRYYHSHFETEPHYGIRTQQHKLIYFHRIDQWEMYDLQNDKSEMINLYHEPKQHALVIDLKRKLHRLQKMLGDKRLDDGSNPW